MDRSLSYEQIFAFRLSRGFLTASESKAEAVEVVSRICGIQAQLALAAAWALRVRSPSTLTTDINTALYASRHLVKTWLMRGTVHLVPSRELGLYIAAIGASAERETLRWLATIGLPASDVQNLADAVAASVAEAPLARKALADAVAARTSPELRPLIAHGWGGVVKLAAIQGLICFGPMIGREITFIARTAWLDGAGAAKPDQNEALSLLLQRYLACYGPATPRDFSHWSGIPINLTRQAFANARLASVTVPSGPAWLLAEDEDAAISVPLSKEAILLECFDPFTLAHAQKDWLAEPAYQKLIYRKAGWVSAIALVDGFACGTWTKARGKHGTEITITPFCMLSTAQRVALTTAASRRFTDLKVAFASTC